MRNYLTIAGRDSRDFGVYISGQGTFSAPEKAYQFYDVPGRNGAVIGNDHRLENIEVSYECFIYSNFDQNIADFRSFLLSLNGYQRLTDSYHPEEFRMAVYTGPFEPEVTPMNNAGSFTLTFNCKPQRWLRSGEAEYSWYLDYQEVEGAYVVSNADMIVRDYLLARGTFPRPTSGTKENPITQWRDASAPTSFSVIVNGNLVAGLATSGTETDFWLDVITGTYYNYESIALIPKNMWTEISGEQNIFQRNLSYWKTIYSCQMYPVFVESTVEDLTVALRNADYGIGCVNGVILLKDKDFSTVAELRAWMDSLEGSIQADVAYDPPQTSSRSPHDPQFPEDGEFSVYAEITGRWADGTQTAVRIKNDLDDTMSNPTVFPASPLIRVYGTGSFTMDGVTVTVTDCDEFVDIDCDLMDCYEGTINRNNDVTFSTYDFPKLQPGNNAIEIISGITKVTMIPRWWMV